MLFVTINISTSNIDDRKSKIKMVCYWWLLLLLLVTNNNTGRENYD